MLLLRRFLMLVLLMMATNVFAAHAQPVSVVVDGRVIQFDQPPVMTGGRILVPLRGIFESLGATVVYDAASRSIRATRASTSVQLTLGSTQAVVNGAGVMMDVPAQTMGGRTVVPLRFISEALGADVRWNAATSTVAINSGGSASAPPPVVQQPPQPQMPQISGVVVNGHRDLAPGDILRVQMTGTPGGVATFDIEGVRRGIPMQERGAGRYRGELTISRQMQARRAEIVVHLRGANGLETMRAADQRVSLGTVRRPTPAGPPVSGPIFINVTSPANGQRLGGNFVLTGTTLPYARVQAQVRIDRSLIPGIIGVTGREMEFSGQADPNGNFSIPINVGQLQRGGSLKLQAQALDQAGNSTQWQQFQYATGP